VIRESIARHAGDDYTCTVKIPVGEKAPPFTPRTTWDEGLRLADMVEEFGYDAVTPVHVSVFPDTTLTRGGVPRSLWKNPSMVRRFRTAAPQRRQRAVIRAGTYLGGRLSPFRPVWNRSRFSAVKARVSIPVMAVGGIRSADEVAAILGAGEADLVGIGRPFYAEPALAAKILKPGQGERVACASSNLCVPAQMLGMKGTCYNPEVRRRASDDRDREGTA
jgi:2,4-dienoyl-CoA reductase-like NADH-dependent reductase (Old Yellow Enzyme family)